MMKKTQTRKSDIQIRASVAASLKDFYIEAAEDERPVITPTEDPAKPPTFEMKCYGGGKLILAGIKYPVVVDLKGLQVTAKSRPVLREHESKRNIGHTTEIRNNFRTLEASGVISVDNADSKEVISASKNGFPWQVSIGAKALKVEMVPQGRNVTVNGQTFSGPVLVARQAQLKELSFVTLGSDDDTEVRLAATVAKTKGVSNMNEFEKWILATFGEDHELTDDQLKDLQATFDNAQLALKTEPGKKKPADDSETDPAVLLKAKTDEYLESIRASSVAEMERIDGIKELCEGHSDIAAKAIKEDWTLEKTEITMLRASRPKPRKSGAADAPAEALVIEAALSMNSGFLKESEAGKLFDEKTMNAAVDVLRDISLRTLMVEVIQASGGHAGNGRVTDAMIEAALKADMMIRAGGTSTLSLSGVLGNVANKYLMKAYNSVISVVEKFCNQTDHMDFKVHTRHRVTADGELVALGKNGEIEHGSMSEETYTNKVDTKARMISLTREDMINDDLGVFKDLVSVFGRGGSNALQRAVYTLLLGNAGSFFHADNNNLLTGAGSALSIEALTAAEAAFLEQTDSNGLPIGITPELLLCPNALKVTAESIYKETKVNETTTANKPKTNENPHAGKFEPVSTPWLSNATIANASTKKWFLFGNPDSAPAIQIAYLQGKRRPTVEGGSGNFNTLGMDWRSFWDFGVAHVDPKAAQRNDGE
ncbi:Mu-like prophage major head subunit gpT family protein [Gimesia sp.]|uniref:phage major capsid protein n=1 Tax=Gimesia sp. TaxID=2024833 RepID=UPI003A8EE2CC